MGLDWNPGPKPKPGFEAEFDELWKKLHQKTCFFRERKVKRFGEITIGAFETLNAPKVGHDERADEWVRAQYPNRADKGISEAEWFERFTGFYVVDLVAPCDGLPRYTNGSAGGYVERFSFRGQFLKDCIEIIGEDLLNSAWNSKPPSETAAYGNLLVRHATAFSEKEGIDAQSMAKAEDPDSKEFRCDVVLSAGRWCQFWASKGHWLEAYF